MKIKITNIFGERLDVLIEGSKESKSVVIFVHGYGTDKDESFATFLDLSKYLNDKFFLVRFDLSGYGKSEGNDFEFQFQKAAGDLDSVIRYVRRNYPDKVLNIIAHSLGTVTASLLSPYNIRKTVFTSVPNSNTEFVITELKKRILSHGGKVDEEGITYYPRTRGAGQKIGPGFWKTLRAYNPCEYLEELGNKTDLIIFKPMQDDVLKNVYFDEYKAIKNIQYVEVSGDHNFKDPRQREELFKKIKTFLLN